MRFLRFNIVGIAGAVVQLGALRLLRSALGVHDIMAVIAAVELAILHNFVWHEAWTWKGLPREAWSERLVRFQLANGLVSIVSNVVFTMLFRHYAGWTLLAANAAAIGSTACLNFLLAHRWVFRRS